MENKNVKVSKMENFLDDCSIITKIAVAGIGIVTGVLSLTYGVRTLKFKKSNPDTYWNNKRNAISEGHRLIAKGLEEVADALRKN